MQLFVPPNDLGAYFGGEAAVVVPVEDRDQIDLADFDAPVLFFIRLDPR